MDKEKKHYYVNMIQSQEDGKMAEVINFNFGGHHDIADMVERSKALGFAKDKHAKEFVLAMRFMHHVIKKNSDNPIFAEFAPQFEAFKHSIKSKVGCGCSGK
ncbi:MAG: DUF3861 domain-containing protein [Paramuribaculum sp.]|nr:DUF3861 domain-containing protein [Paramuribaculum sp.]MDE7452141.1 DUF3861 domain-containing protein [Paramuribaculum sp.]